MKKQLTKKQKTSIKLAVRDALFQQFAEMEESMTNEAREEIKYVFLNDDIDTENEVVRKIIEKEMASIINRIYASL